MTLPEYASARSSAGDCVRQYGGMHWTVAKGLFYRPLLRHQPCSPSRSEMPRTLWGGFQYAVRDSREANSRVGFLVIDRVRDYALERVRCSRRWLIKDAARRFTVGPITDESEFLSRGHSVYVSFYQRTGYQHRSDRNRPEGFARWAKSILGSPKTIVFGGFGPTGLVAVSISYWVGTTLVYSSFFSETAALENGVGELMFHTLRQVAARTDGIQEILLRPYQGGTGMDKYYLLRGARLAWRPARLHFPLPVRLALKVFAPARYSSLFGPPEAGQTASEVSASATTDAPAHG